MPRFVLSVVALVGVLATAHPTFGDSPTATASDRANAAAPATQPVALAPARSSSSDTGVPASVERGNAIPVGFGWG